LYIVYTADKNKPTLVLWQRGDSREIDENPCKQKRKEHGNKLSLELGFADLKPSRICFVLSVAAHFSVLCLVLEQKVRIQFKGFVVSKSVSN
jgi:hypothetical protein